MKSPEFESITGRFAVGAHSRAPLPRHPPAATPKRHAVMPGFENETIHLQALRLECTIGVEAQERKRPQTLLLSLSFPQDFAAAAEGDDLAETVDYSAVARAAREFAGQGEYRLLETLARRLADHLGQRFGLEWLELWLEKPGALGEGAEPAVSLTWVGDGAEGP
ncbi:MAG: dihydroneopterin aldolase [bacterium]